MIQSKNKSGPQARPSKYLQALRDFSVFQFISIDSQNPVTKQVRFLCQPGGRSYSLDVRNFCYQKGTIPISRQTKEDINAELATLIQIIEIYSDRYPDRTIRLGGEKKESSQLYQAAIERYVNKISSLFVIDRGKRRFLRNDRQSNNSLLAIEKKAHSLHKHFYHPDTLE